MVVSVLVLLRVDSQAIKAQAVSMLFSTDFISFFSYPHVLFLYIQKIMWKLNKSIAKELLPTQPVDFPIESWWGVCLVNFTLEEFKVRSESPLLNGGTSLLMMVFTMLIWQ
jgi:hypothetical protein